MIQYFLLFQQLCCFRFLFPIQKGTFHIQLGTQNIFQKQSRVRRNLDTHYFQGGGEWVGSQERNIFKKGKGKNNPISFSAIKVKKRSHIWEKVKLQHKILQNKVQTNFSLKVLFSKTFCFLSLLCASSSYDTVSAPRFCRKPFWNSCSFPVADNWSRHNPNACPA